MAALVCVEDFERYAYQHLPRNALDYYRSGANDEQSLKDNRLAFSRYLLCQLQTCQVSHIRTRGGVIMFVNCFYFKNCGKSGYLMHAFESFEWLVCKVLIWKIRIKNLVMIGWVSKNDENPTSRQISHFKKWTVNLCSGVDWSKFEPFGIPLFHSLRYKYIYVYISFLPLWTRSSS